MKAIFITLSILLPTLCLAQTSANHKTYSGAFPSSDSYGNADYSYLTSESGERIFDGQFKYTAPFRSLEGNFKNNRQVGKWVGTWPNNSSGPKALIKTVLTANFGENGYLDGNFKIQEFYRNGSVIDVLDATFRNGRLNGPFKGKVKEGYFSGQYKSDLPVGKWKYSWIDAPVDFDKKNSSGYVPVKHVNPATGDIAEVFETMPTDPNYKNRSIGWWIQDIQMRGSRMITFNPYFPYEERKLSNGCFEGKRTAGFETQGDLAEPYLLKIGIPENLLNSNDLRGNWSDWEDFILRNCELTIEELGESPVTIDLLLDLDGDGNIELIEKDDKVDDKLNNETLRLLKKLQWIFGVNDYGTLERETKQGLRAYCNVEITFDPVKMESNLNVFNENKRKKQEQIEAAKRYEESFAPITYAIVDKASGNGTENDDKICENPQEMPQFPGGMTGMAQFISQHLKYPASAAENGISGKVIVGFVVRKDGTISDVKIIRGKHPDLDKEAMRVVKIMPKFKPAKSDGKPVNARFNIPINFSLGK